MRRNPLRGRAWMVAVAAAATAGAGGLLGGVAARGDAVPASVVQVGWWSQQPGAQAQSGNGFQVTLGAQGNLSVAAVELNVGGASSATTTLTLAEASTSVTASRAVLQACMIPGSWAPANPGAWTAAPPYDCSSKVALNRDASSSTWTADVSALAQPGHTTSLMIVPVPQPVAGVLEPGFQVTFTGASVKATGTTSPPDTSSYVGSTDTTPSTTPDTAAVPAAPVTSLPTTAFTTPPVAAPLPGDASVVTTPAPAPAASPTPAAATSGFVATPTFAKAASHRPVRPWWRLVVFVPLALAAGAAGAELRRRAAAAS